MSSEIWESICKIEKTNDIELIAAERDFVCPKAKEFWNDHPHSAMELLECIAEVYPIKVAHALVREIVLDWQSRKNYSWKAGGSADHCFLSALLLTGNGDLADDDFISKCLDSVIKKAEHPRNRNKDSKEKVALLRKFSMTREDYSIAEHLYGL